MDIFRGLFQNCDHTRLPLERRVAHRRDFSIGLPGLPPAIKFGQIQPPGGYLYYCPACQINLPSVQNSRWETLYTAGIRRSSPPSTRSQPGRPKTRQVSRRTDGYKREPIGAGLRYTILERDGFRCVKCGANSQQTKLHIDHKIPVSKGGTNEPSNLQTLCERCNLGKGTRLG